MITGFSGRTPSQNRFGNTCTAGLTGYYRYATDLTASAKRQAKKLRTSYYWNPGKSKNEDKKEKRGKSTKKSPFHAKRAVSETQHS